MNFSTVRILTLLLPVLAVSSLQAQRRNADPAQLFDVLPSSLDRHAIALGDRVRVPGKERTVFTGNVIDESGARTPVRIVVQLPAMVGLEGLRSKGQSLIFDGKNPARGSRLEEHLIEILSADSTEGMLASIRSGSAVELLGRRVHDGSPRLHDIFEVSTKVLSRSVSQDMVKRYYFDSDSALLSKTTYEDDAYSPPVTVDILFSDWRSEGASSYPARIERLENARPVLTLTIDSIVALPRQDPSIVSEFAAAGSQEE